MRIAVVGSREFNNYIQMRRELKKIIDPNDHIVSGGASGADSMAQRFTQQEGIRGITIWYPQYEIYGKPATFQRNTTIAEDSELVVAFYQKGRPQQGGTWDTVKKAKKLGHEVVEFEEE